MPKMLVKDINLAGYLIAIDLPYELESVERGRADFSFENNQQLRDALHAFNNGAMIQANKYSESIRLAKSILYSFKQST